MKKYCLFVICLGAVFTALATDSSTGKTASFKEKINSAIVKFEHTQTELWSYTISRYEDEKGDITSSMEQYYPQFSGRWLIKQLNGQPPTKIQIKAFAKKKNKQSNKTKQQNEAGREYTALVAGAN